MRTQDEIVKRIESRKADDLLGFETGEYINRLDFSNARPFLKDSVTEQDWLEACVIKPPIKRMHDYMEFAWGKANNCRGISANRSVMHCIAWLWLAEEDELLMQVEDEFNGNYHFYGKPILEIICEHFDWDWSQWDNGIRSNG